MAKKKNTENVKKIQTDYLQFLKVITKWLTNTKRTDDQLEDIIHTYDIENNIVKRILSYHYSFPYIIHYFNNYLNNKFTFDSLDTKILLKSIVYLMDINNRNNSKTFMFIKSNELKDEIKNTIKNLIKDYMWSTFEIECNRRDLVCYYKLFKAGHIKDEDLLAVDRILNNDKPVIKSLNFINYEEALNTNEKVLNTLDIVTEETNFTDEIVNFIKSIKDEKINREQCKSCGLYKKPIVVLDTNCEKLQEVDITFIGLNPGTDEVKKDKPFVGDSGKYIRKIIDQLPKDKKWVIFNIILCNTPNKNEIVNLSGGIKQITENCKDMVRKIFGAFPSKIFVPIGDDAKGMFGITAPITSVSGKIFEVNNDIKIIPIVHPSSILRNSKYQSIFDSSVKNILNLFDVKDTDINVSAKEKKIESMVENTEDLLLVDVKRIENNNVLMIYTDLKGNKKYSIEEYKYPLLIKNKTWKDCNIITDDISDICYVSDYQKSLISKKCHQKLKEMVTL